MAILTVPNLVKNYQKSAALTRLQKFYSNIQQVVALSELSNGPVATWQQTTGGAQVTKNFNTYWAPFLKVAKICTSVADCGYPEANL